MWLSTTAKKDGEEWVLRGHKWFATGADGAAFAICMATTNPDAERPHARASMVLVPTDTVGFERLGNLSIMGDRGGDWASHGEVSYVDARVPLSNLLGGEGMGFLIAQERLGPGRIHHCMRWVGVCERAFDILCRHAATRELSPGKPLGTRQMVQQWIAESRAEIDQARLLVLHAAWKIEREGAPAARQEISIIKFTVARTLQRVVRSSNRNSLAKVQGALIVQSIRARPVNYEVPICLKSQNALTAHFSHCGLRAWQT